MTTAAALDSPAPAAPHEEPPPSPSLLTALMREHRRDLGVGAAMLAATSFASAAVPQLIRAASDAIVASHARAGMAYAAGIVVAAVVAAAARVWSRILIFNSGRNIEYDLRARMLERLHTLGPSFFRRISAGEVMSRATNDLGQVRLLVGFGVLNVVNAVVSYAANIPLMLWRSPLLTAAALAPYPLFILVTRGFSSAMFQRSRATQNALGAMSERAQRSLAGIRVVRAYGLEAYEADEFDKLSRDALEANLALVRLRGGMMPILALSAALSSIIVLWLGGRLATEGRLTVGDILAFQAHLALVAWPTLALGYILSIVQRGRASLERVNEILRAEPDVAEGNLPPAEGLRGAVQVDGLTYESDGRKLLDGVSFDLPAGGSLAVVGRTGSGKSVLAALLGRMLPTPAGRVFLDGRDVTAMRLRDLRSAVCLVQQEPFLFSTTVGRNIAFGDANPDAAETFDRAREAAREAQILAEVESMPDGLDTIVGERGVQLSGGQKQRVALARGLMAEPRVLVLDDPLSAVDAQTEVAILNGIERAAAGRTLVLVTHRIAAAARCKQVIVLEEGRVVERGSHAELLAGGGLYARLAERQALEAELEAIA